jgi:hypothetical protein
VNAAETIRAAAAVPVDRVSLTLDRTELDELVTVLDELQWLQEEVTRLGADLEQARAREFRPTNGHWYVEDGTYSCIGEIADLDTARVRVALHRALPDACKAVVALHGRQSAHDLVSAALNAAARHYAQEPAS